MTVNESELSSQQIALTWLALSDSGNYAESWRTAANCFRDELSEAEWASRLREARAPLAGIESRTLRSSQSMTEPSTSPDGDYLI